LFCTSFLISLILFLIQVCNGTHYNNFNRTYQVNDQTISGHTKFAIQNLPFQIKVFKPFGVEELGLYINQTLEDEFCPSDSLLVSWNPGSTSRPNKSWLASVWSFLTEQTMHITRWGMLLHVIEWDIHNNRWGVDIVVW